MTLCLSLAVTVLLCVALAWALVLLLGTETGLALFVAVVGLLVAAQVTVGGPLELRLTPVHERSSEEAAELSAARITGSPAVVAAALRKLDGVEASPTRDLRSRHSSIQEFCIVPEERSSDGDGPFAFESDSYHPRTSRFATEWPLVARLTRTHPPVEARVERLRALEGEVTS